MQVSGSDSNAPFVHSHFFPEALKDENAGRAQEAQKETHSREVESNTVSAQEDTVNIQHAPDATHASPATPQGHNNLAGGDARQAGHAAHEENPLASEEHKAEPRKAKLFDDSGNVTTARAGAVVDIFG